MAGTVRFYSSFNFTQRPSSYLTFNNISISTARVIAQIRLSTKYVCKFLYKGFSYSFNSDELCSVCNMHVLETFYHIFFVCPLYSEVRPAYLSDVEFFRKLSSLNPALANEIRQVTLQIMRLRAFLRNE